MQRRQDAFSGCHPAVQFLFFALVLGFAMCLTHPAVLLAALLGGFCYGWVLYGKNMLRGTLLGVLPVLLVTALVNPAFNHQGATILTYLPSGNPLTLESILSGVGGGLLLPSDDLGQIRLFVRTGYSGPVAGAVYDLAFCAPFSEATQDSDAGAKKPGAGPGLWLSAPTPAAGVRGPVYPHHLGFGERSGHGR